MFNWIVSRWIGFILSSDLTFSTVWTAENHSPLLYLCKRLDFVLVRSHFVVAIDYSCTNLSLLMEGKSCCHRKSYSKYFTFPVLLGQRKGANIYFPWQAESSPAAGAEQAVPCALCCLSCPKLQRSRLCWLAEGTHWWICLLQSERSFPRELSISAQLVWGGVLELQINNSIWFSLSVPNLPGPGDRDSVPSYFQEKQILHCLRGMARVKLASLKSPKVSQQVLCTQSLSSFKNK